MRLELNEQEKRMFQNLTGSVDGKVLEGFIQRMISTVESVRTKIDMPTDSRIAVADFLEKNFIDRFKVLRNEVASPDNNEHE